MKNNPIQSQAATSRALHVYGQLRQIELSNTNLVLSFELQNAERDMEASGRYQENGS